MLLHLHSIYNQLWLLKTKLMNIMCNEGVLGFFKGDWSKMREPPPNGGGLKSMEVYFGRKITQMLFRHF